MKPSEPTPPRDQTAQSDQDILQERSNAQIAGHSRRAFLFKLSLLANGAVGAVLAVPIIGYLLGPSLKKSSSYTSWITLGPIGDFPENETRLVNFRNPITTPWDGQTGDIPCWVRRVSGSTFQVFAINCAHLGCPVRWFAQSKLFLCPCHGGAYYADGSRASGPPERGLFEYDHKIIANALMIKVGKMPTLAQHACAEPPLRQLDGSTNLVSIEKPKSGSATCQG
jgi:menaquinol-cytochrome c reductase iron-sulfur subunit